MKMKSAFLQGYVEGLILGFLRLAATIPTMLVCVLYHVVFAPDYTLPMATATVGDLITLLLPLVIFVAFAAIDVAKAQP